MKEMPDYITRSYVPFMKAVWRVQNPDQFMTQPPILVADHERNETCTSSDSSLQKCIDE